MYGGLAGAIGLWWWSRTRTGAAAVADATGETLEFIDVSASRIKAAIVSRGYRNNNPGNIRWIANASQRWNGMVSNDGGYGVFDTPRNGTRALGRQLLKYSERGLRTVRDIVSTWAPSNENDTSAYVKDVAQQLGVSADAALDVRARLPQLARAIAKHENGYLDDAYDWQWVYL